MDENAIDGKARGPKRGAVRGRREIEVFAEASSVDGWRKLALAGQPDAGRFALVSDEGEYLPGGEGTAPTPLTYFVAGVALWLLSQVSQVATRKKIGIEKERVKVTARFAESGSVLAGTRRGSCLGFEIELSLSSAAPREELAALLELAHRMCFTEAALANPVPLEVRHVVNGSPLERPSGG